MRKRSMFASLVLGSALLVGGAAIPAQAATPAVSSTASGDSVTAVPADWQFYTDYFWESSCIDAGKDGVGKYWRAWECREGGLFTYYELWVLPY